MTNPINSSGTQPPAPPPDPEDPFAGEPEPEELNSPPPNLPQGSTSKLQSAPLNQAQKSYLVQMAQTCGYIELTIGGQNLWFTASQVMSAFPQQYQAMMSQGNVPPPYQGQQPYSGQSGGGGGTLRQSYTGPGGGGYGDPYGGGGYGGGYGSGGYGSGGYGSYGSYSGYGTGSL